MTEEQNVMKIEDLTKGKFTIIAKVTFADAGDGTHKFLQRGLLSDETGSIDFVIYSDAQLESLVVGKVYKLTNVFASDNTGFLTLRPNKRMDGCTAILLDEELETNSSRIFRDSGSISSVLKDETCAACSMIFNRILNEKFPSDISIEDKTLMLAVSHDNLKERYKTGAPIPYRKEEFQNAYMFGFFPFYIGMIYHILREKEFENPSDLFKNDLKICLYGSGPAPEILGFVGYLRDFHSDVRRINVTFLDQNNWDDWRNFCLTQLIPLFWDGEIQHTSVTFNLFQFPDASDKEIINIISLASIHNFQNVISDLYKSPENLDKLRPSFFNLYQRTATNSIMILSDQYYGQTRRIFNQISQITNKQKFGNTIVKPESVQNYQREFDNPQPMKDIGHYYKKNMGFYSMVLKRT
jgi:hypothetical protein